LGEISSIYDGKFRFFSKNHTACSIHDAHNNAALQICFGSADFVIKAFFCSKKCVKLRVIVNPYKCKEPYGPTTNFQSRKEKTMAQSVDKLASIITMKFTFQNEIYRSSYFFAFYLDIETFSAFLAPIFPILKNLKFQLQTLGLCS
jgi:hypothetical protein